MKKLLTLLQQCVPILTIGLLGSALTAVAQEKHRVVIMTDMTHDDGNSLIRYLYYANYFDTEAIIITPQLPDFHHNAGEPWQKGDNILKAYRQEYTQLVKHQPDLPTYETLAAVTKKGRGALPIIWLTNTKYFKGGIAGREVESSWGDIRFADWIGEGLTPNGEPKDSEGSELLIKVFEKDDSRPIYVQMWGGPITFVQALYRFQQKHGARKYQQLLAKLHIFGILLQDITFDYFIDLDKVQALQCANMGDVASTYQGPRSQAGWLLHDASHFWKYLKVMEQQEVNGHGPMSELYDHGGEGDTPAFLYLLSASFGLNNPLEPGQGSWGSRFVPMGQDFPQHYYHTCQVPQTELERWITHAKNSFLNRLQWSVKNPDEVNHEPKAVLNGDATHAILQIRARPGKKITLDASASTDPDGDALRFNWYPYPEAGTYSGTLALRNPNAARQVITVPKDLGSQNLHLILEVHDQGSPSLVTYRRVIITGE
jgi:hypothetical protein